MQVKPTTCIDFRIIQSTLKKLRKIFLNSCTTPKSCIMIFFWKWARIHIFIFGFSFFPKPSISLPLYNQIIAGLWVFSFSTIEKKNKKVNYPCVPYWQLHQTWSILINPEEVWLIYYTVVGWGVFDAINKKLVSLRFIYQPASLRTFLRELGAKKMRLLSSR